MNRRYCALGLVAVLTLSGCVLPPPLLPPPPPPFPYDGPPQGRRGPPPGWSDGAREGNGDAARMGRPAEQP